MRSLERKEPALADKKKEGRQSYAPLLVARSFMYLLVAAHTSQASGIRAAARSRSPPLAPALPWPSRSGAAQTSGRLPPLFRGGTATCAAGVPALRLPRTPRKLP